MRNSVRRLGVGLLLLAALCAHAQQTVNLWPGVAPGSENATYNQTSENVPGTGLILHNVTVPTLTVYLPEKSKATGTAVIIAPGGAFIALAMDVEGKQVAEWLNQRGVAAFVLKYRLMEYHGGGIPQGLNWDEAAKQGIADGIQAIKLVRERAKQWGVEPDRVVFVGFSAGAMVTSGVLLQEDAALRPNYAAPIYGAPFGVMPKIPKTLPPVFMAWAQDDPLVLPFVQKFYAALMEAGHKPEAHIYMAGGHGFGMRTPGATSDHWIDEFYWWLGALGLTKPAASN